MIRRQTASILVFVALIACAGMNGCPNQDGMDDPMMPGDMNPNPNPNPDPNPGGNDNTNSTPNGNGNGNTNDNVNDNSPPPPPPRDPPEWNAAFITDNNTPMDTTDDVGALTSVWGSGPNDVFVVGGKGFPPAAKIYHYNGSTWNEMTPPSAARGLDWVFGFGPSDVYAVGLDGAMIHYDGTSWSQITTPGITDQLWGIWGTSPGDMWIVGGKCGLSEPTLLHCSFDSNTNIHTFNEVTPFPTNDRDPCQLLKVWGFDSKIFAVGEKGLILEHQSGMNWVQQSSGVNEKFVSLWGTSSTNMVAVGGQNTGQLAVYNGTAWTTHKPAGQPALNAVFMDETDLAIIGGFKFGGTGYLGSFNPSTTTVTEEGSASSIIHAIWGDGQGKYYAVGGDFSQFNWRSGVSLVRTYGPPGFSPAVPSSP